MNKNLSRFGRLTAFIACLVLAATVFFEVVHTFEDSAHAQNNFQTQSYAPIGWYNQDQTAAFLLDTNATPTILITGTNYSGISTNVALTNLYRLTIKKGVIVGLSPL